MRRVLLLILLVCNLLLYSQNDLSAITPASPQSAALISSGNVPLNEYKGMVNLTIPLTSYVEGSINGALSIKYTQPGVRVTDFSNSVGVNWLLSAGGVITRTIYDQKDEYMDPNFRIMFENHNDIFNLANSQNGSSAANLLNNYIKNPNYDNEVDLYNISVDGYNGSFYLDKFLQPVLLQNSNQFKIETVGDFKTNHEFILTTNEGMKYYFGGPEAVEKTRIREDFDASGVTSFYLTKIQDLHNREVFFKYKNTGGKTFFIHHDQTRTLSTEVFSPCNTSGDLFMADVNKNTLMNLNNIRTLSEIKGSNFRIEFNYLNTNASINDKLTKIVVYFNDKKSKQIEFKYIDKIVSNSLERFFLQEVENYNFVNDTAVFDNEYILDYEDPLSIPERNSFALDVLDYYNGKNNNTNAVPNLNLLGNTNYQGISQLADRTSNFEYAKKGTLLSVTYPTKGKTFFEYEGLPIEVAIPGTMSGIIEYSPPNYIQTQTSQVFTGDEIANNVISFTFSINQDEPTIAAANMGKATITITDNATGAVLLVKEVKIKHSLNDEYSSFTEIKFDFITQKGKIYKISLNGENTTSPFRYTAEYEGGFVSRYEIGNGGGIRLKRMYDLESGQQQNVKRLYYTSLDNIGKSSGLPNNYYMPGKFLRHLYNAKICTYPDGTMTLFHSAGEQTIIKSQATLGILDGENDNDPVFPQVIISYGGDHFEKGGEQKTFKSGEVDELVVLSTVTSNADYLGINYGAVYADAHLDFLRYNLFSDYNGRLLDHQIWKSVNGALFMDKKIHFEYGLIEQSRIFSLIGKEVYLPIDYTIGTNNLNIVHNLFIGSFKRGTYSVFLNKKIESEYIGNVLLTQAENTSNKITTQKDYSYNNPSHYQVTSQKTTFADLSTQEISYQYAHEKGNQKLVNANMVGIPLETTTFKNNKALSKVETIYPNQSNFPTIQAGNLLLPLSVQSVSIPTISTATPAVGETRETELTYDFYDIQGNLLQYSSKSGVSTAIIWGYNNTQPIAKIEGATYAQVSAAAAAIVTASNTDAAQSANNDETSFLALLDTFRKSLSAYQVSTYTYDPLIGVRSTTPPSGIREVYIYDSANRLQTVKDMGGNILKEYEYNYKH